MVTDPNSVCNPNCNEYRRPFHRGLHSQQNHGWIGSVWSLFLGYLRSLLTKSDRIEPSSQGFKNIPWLLRIVFFGSKPQYSKYSKRMNLRCSHQVKGVGKRKKTSRVECTFTMKGTGVRFWWHTSVNLFKYLWHREWPHEYCSIQLLIYGQIYISCKKSGLQAVHASDHDTTWSQCP